MIFIVPERQKCWGFDPDPTGAACNAPKTP